MKSPLHIVFGDSAGESLKDSFTIDNVYEGEIICMNDNLAMGPINNISTRDGKIARRDWWNKITNGTNYNKWILSEIDNAVEEDKYRFIKATAKRSGLCIWLGHDTNSRVGFMKLMYELRNTKATILVMDYPHKKFKYSIGYHLFQNISILNSEQIIKMKKYIRKIKSSEIKAAIKNWKDVSSTPSKLRVVVQNGIIKNVPESYYDKLLLSNCTTEFQKAAIVIGNTLGKLATTRKWIGDIYLNWRLKELSNKNRLLFEGDLKEIRDYKIKLYCT